MRSITESIAMIMEEVPVISRNVTSLIKDGEQIDSETARDATVKAEQSAVRAIH